MLGVAVFVKFFFDIRSCNLNANIPSNTQRARDIYKGLNQKEIKMSLFSK